MHSGLFITLIIIKVFFTGTAYARVEKSTKAGIPGAIPHTAVGHARHEVRGFDMRVWISNRMTMGLQAFDAGTIPRA